MSSAGQLEFQALGEAVNKEVGGRRGTWKVGAERGGIRDEDLPETVLALNTAQLLLATHFSQVTFHFQMLR